jgi:hypothetical protein
MQCNYFCSGHWHNHLQLSGQTVWPMFNLVNLNAQNFLGISKYKQSLSKIKNLLKFLKHSIHLNFKYRKTLNSNSDKQVTMLQKYFSSTLELLESKLECLSFESLFGINIYLIRASLNLIANNLECLSSNFWRSLWFACKARAYQRK